MNDKQKNTLTNNWLLIIVVLLIQYSCSKEPPFTNDIVLPEALKKAFYYPQGAYWIVEERATGANYRDSLYVKSSRIDTVEVLHPGSRRPFARKEVLKTRVVWPFYGMEFEITSESAVLCHERSVQGEPCHFVNLEFFYEGKSRGKTRMMYFPAVVDRGWPVVMSGLIEPKLRIDTIFERYTQSGRTFEKVWRVITEQDRSFQGTVSVRYISPEFGIIRWYFPLFGIDWEVVRVEG